MIEMQVSRSVKEGSIVTKRGNKYILAYPRSKIVGIFTGGDLRKTLTLDGEIVESRRPMGIVFYGVASARHD